MSPRVEEAFAVGTVGDFGHFFKNNYIRQTILLVGQGLKLFWYLTNRVCYTRFPSCATI